MLFIFSHIYFKMLETCVNFSSPKEWQPWLLVYIHVRVHVVAIAVVCSDSVVHSTNEIRMWNE